MLAIREDGKDAQRLMVIVAAAAMLVGMLPGTASAGQYCEQLDRTDAGEVCRIAGSAAIGACNKVAGIWGNECGLG